MNILFLSAVLPYPLHSGGQVRLYQLLRRLSKKHRITLVSYIREEAERQYVEKLSFCEHVFVVKRGYAWRPSYVFHALTTSFPFLMATYDISAMKSLLQKVLLKNRFDRIHCEPFYVYGALPKTDIPIIVSEHNIEYDVYARYVDRFPIPFLRPFLSLDVKKMMRWERYVWRKARKVTAVSPEDARVISTYLSQDVPVVSNGVDTTEFSFSPPRKEIRQSLLFVGNFRWLPNREAAVTLLTSIWPQIRKEFTTSSLSIVGRYIPPTLVGLAKKHGATILEGPSDIASVYRSCDVLVAPHAISGGTKYKMLEAMASGTVIVTSQQGMAGLSAKPGLTYLVARTPKEYVHAVSELFRSYELRSSLAKEARFLVETAYAWDTIAAALDSVWKRA